MKENIKLYIKKKANRLGGYIDLSLNQYSKKSGKKKFIILIVCFLIFIIIGLIIKYVR
jgi:uncharacterized membrane protein